MLSINCSFIWFFVFTLSTMMPFKIKLKSIVKHYLLRTSINYSVLWMFLLFIRKQIYLWKMDWMWWFLPKWQIKNQYLTRLQILSENKGKLIKSDSWNKMLTSKPQVIGKAFDETMLWGSVRWTYFLFTFHLASSHKMIRHFEKKGTLLREGYMSLLSIKKRFFSFQNCGMRCRFLYFSFHDVWSCWN